MDKIHFWNTSYALVMQQQNEFIHFIQKHPERFVIMVGSHLHCFTVGRGLQKKSGAVLDHLQEFSMDGMDQKYPEWELYQTSRAGGMTFHHPGQIIIYPLMNLNYYKISLPKIMFLLLEAVKTSLLDLKPELRMEVKREPLGLWINDRKVASIGMAMDRFVTCHGLALNLSFDSKVKLMLSQEFPCGLPGELYGSLSDFIDSKLINISELSSNMTDLFFKQIKAHL